MQTPDSLVGFKGCRSQAAGTVRGLAESQPAYYTELSRVAHYNLCPRAVAIARNVETTLGCGLTNTILASAKMSSYFLLVLLCAGDQLSWELFLFHLYRCKVKIKRCHARTAAPCSHCDRKQSRLHLCSRSLQQQWRCWTCPGKMAGLKVKPCPGSQGTVWHGQRLICYYTTHLDGFHLLIAGNRDRNDQVESFPGQFCTKMQLSPTIMLGGGVVEWKEQRKN